MNGLNTDTERLPYYHGSISCNTAEDRLLKTVDGLEKSLVMGSYLLRSHHRTLAAGSRVQCEYILSYVEENKSQGGKEKVKHIIKNVTPKKLAYKCNQNGRVFNNKESEAIDLISDIEVSSDESSVQITNKRRERAQR